MFTMLAVVAYLAALAGALLLLKTFGSAHWSWHVLAILAALGMGLMPTPESLQGPGVDIAFGFVFLLVMSWGIGGIVVFRPHQHLRRHARHA
jgi:hypothetical protein